MSRLGSGMERRKNGERWQWEGKRERRRRRTRKGNERVRFRCITIRLDSGGSWGCFGGVLGGFGGANFRCITIRLDSRGSWRCLGGVLGGFGGVISGLRGFWGTWGPLLSTY